MTSRDSSLNNVPSLIFLFGLAGAGKTFCGRLIAGRLGYFCYDLDTDCTPAMKSAIQAGQSFTDQMRDDFFEVVCARISQLVALHPKVLVMQAAYKNRHRALVMSRFPAAGLVWVDSPDDLITKRLRARGDIVSAEYAERIRANFEAPTQGARLVNDIEDTEELLTRFTDLFGRT
jgi:gluconate kinase